MEKAKTGVKIELEDGKTIDIIHLTLDFLAKGLPKFKLDGKEKEGKFTSLSLKRGLIKDTPTEYVERRVFKNADTDVVVYDLPLPLTIAQATAMYGESDVLDAIWTAKRIKTDASKAGKGQADPIVSLVRKAQKGETLTVPEKQLLAKWYGGMTKVK